MKYKKLTNSQLILSVDRLTRFKNTKEKYLRVYSDIIVSSLLEPKIKKDVIESTDFTLLTGYVTEIINGSLGKVCKNTNINKKIADYENSIYYNDDSTQKLLNNNINYAAILDILPPSPVPNLLWLKHLENFDISMRKKYHLKYPLEKVLLVEGITEEILLPEFSKFTGYDFHDEGVQIIPAGGKNQVVKMYYKLINEIRLPIYILLDKDAEENIRQIEPKLRKIDKIHLVSCGEFEDLLPKSLIVKTVNSHFKNFLSITEKDLISELPAAKTLEELFKTRGLHEFKKAEFAKLVKENINQKSDISDEIMSIINEISI